MHAVCGVQFWNRVILARISTFLHIGASKLEARLQTRGEAEARLWRNGWGIFWLFAALLWTRVDVHVLLVHPELEVLIIRMVKVVQVGVFSHADARVP